MNPKLILGIPTLALCVALVTLIRPDAQETMDQYQRARPVAPERALRRLVQSSITVPSDSVWKPFPKCPTHNLDTNGHYALTLVDSKGVEYVTCYKDYQDAQFLLLRLAGLRMIRKGEK